MFNSNQAFLLGAKVEISPQGLFTLGVKAVIEKNFFKKFAPSY
jgi:hypothetical protein